MFPWCTCIKKFYDVLFNNLLGSLSGGRLASNNSLSGLTNHGGISVTGSSRYSGSTVAIGNQNDIPRLGVSTILVNAGPRMASSMLYGKHGWWGKHWDKHLLWWRIIYDRCTILRHAFVFELSSVSKETDIEYSLYLDAIHINNLYFTTYKKKTSLSFTMTNAITFHNLIFKNYTCNLC